jgi:hypothetical protein
MVLLKNSWLNLDGEQRKVGSCFVAKDSTEKETLNIEKRRVQAWLTMQ